MGPAEIAFTRMHATAQVIGEIPHDRFERRLRDAGHVVVGHDRRRSVVGQGHETCALVEALVERADQRDQRVGRDIEREREPGPRRLVDLAREVFLLHDAPNRQRPRPLAGGAGAARPHLRRGKPA
jgi:hypothetical protein